MIAWIAFGWRPDEASDGQVWVTSRGPGGAWRNPQTVNTAPVTRNYGGVAVAAAPGGELRLLYASGDPDTVSVVYEVTSSDDGKTWSLPRELTEGSVQALRADSEGGWHALIIGPEPFNSQLRYGYAAPGGAWTWTAIGPATDEYRADLGLLELGGRKSRIVLTTRAGTTANPQPHLHLYRSDDGVAWVRATQAPMPAEAVSDPTIRPQLLAVPRGDGLVVAAWSNYGSGMVLASISTDGGRSFGPVEVIAQHSPDGSFSPEIDYGIEPGLGYDPQTDVLVASWNEIETGAGETFPWPTRSYLARRPLDRPLGQPWLDGVTPGTIDQPRRILDRQRRTYLFATPDGAHAGLIIIDERNYQSRMTYREVHLPALTTQAES
ncbi:sialidase family protein [Chloroflexus sp.]|uniref:sialidase family protein n=1 Tax=Chloroflexus sp. TaxID=1904827 RepID=UPI002ACE08EF|nr:sialidase family protein [Chloroflexus sp.]